jgi:hypothetical protein
MRDTARRTSVYTHRVSSTPGEAPSPYALPLLALILALIACGDKPDSDSEPPSDSPVDSPVDSEETAVDSPPSDSDTGQPHTGTPDDTAGETGDTVDTGDTGEPLTMVEKLDPYSAPMVHFSPDPLVPGDPVTISYEGALVGSAKNLDLYYGFDGTVPIWSEATTPTHTGFEITMDVPSDALVLHVEFQDPDTGDVDDYDERGYRAAVGFPALGPWLSWSATALPGSGVRVSWETTQPCLGVVEYGSTDALGSWTVGAYEDTVHHVEVTGLVSGDTLHYRVWDSRGQVSEVFEYAVPDTSADHKFIAWSDLQPYTLSGRLEDTTDVIVADHSDAAFAIAVGDLVGWDNPVIWWVMLHEAGGLLSSVPLVPVSGNHDGYSSTSIWGFDRYLAPPYASVDEPWYSLDFGSTHLMSLYSNDMSTLQEGGDQYTWVESDLAGCWHGGTRVCDPVIAAFHVPPYNVGTRHFYEQGGVRPVTALFDGEVDWHIAGHEHLYQRFQPLQYERQLATSGSYGVGADEGVGYLVLPTAGSSEGGGIIDPEDKAAGIRDLLAFPAIAADATSFDAEMGFVVVEVGTADLTITAWGLGTWTSAEPAHEIESYSYTR